MSCVLKNEYSLVNDGMGRKQAIPSVESIIVSLFHLLLIEHLCINHCDIDAKDIMVNKTVLHPERRGFWGLGEKGERIKKDTLTVTK